MQFPRTEVETEVFARQVLQGMVKESASLPAPPMPLETLQLKLDAYKALADAIVLAEQALSEQHAAKDRAFKELVDGLKVNLKYSEAVFRSQPEKLRAMAWGPRRDATNLEEPGEVTGIQILKQGETSVMLRWRVPGGGGTPAYYQIQRKQAEAPWEDAGTSTESEVTLINQPRGVQLTYWVYAVNRAGAGSPSSIVTAVL